MKIARTTRSNLPRSLARLSTHHPSSLAAIREPAGPQLKSADLIPRSPERTTSTNNFRGPCRVSFDPNPCARKFYYRTRTWGGAPWNWCVMKPVLHHIEIGWSTWAAGAHAWLYCLGCMPAGGKATELTRNQRRGSTDV